MGHACGDKGARPPIGVSEIWACSCDDRIYEETIIDH